MTIFHCLFWIKGNMITSLLYEAGTLNVLKFKGRRTVPLTDVFWDEWKEYAGMCHGDTTDFCLIYDEKPVLNNALMSAHCENTECIWSRNKIDEAVKVLEVTEPTEIRNENGMLLVKAGCFLNVRKEDIKTMTAWYIKAEKDDAENEKLSKSTAFLRYYKAALEEYKNGYEKNRGKKK